MARAAKDKTISSIRFIAILASLARTTLLEAASARIGRLPEIERALLAGRVGGSGRRNPGRSSQKGRQEAAGLMLGRVGLEDHFVSVLDSIARGLRNDRGRAGGIAGDRKRNLRAARGRKQRAERC